MQGDGLLEPTYANWEITVLDHDSKPRDVQLVGLRQFESAAILVEVGNRVSVVPAKSILKIQRTAQLIPSRCALSEWACPFSRTLDGKTSIVPEQ